MTKTVNGLKGLEKMGVKALVLGTTNKRKNMAEFYLLYLNEIDSDEFEMLFDSEGTFRTKRTNRRIITKGTHLSMYDIDMDLLKKYGAENNGYNAEIHLFGAANYTTDKIDGVIFDIPVQVKTSFDYGNGTSKANKL